MRINVTFYEMLDGEIVPTTSRAVDVVHLARRLKNEGSKFSRSNTRCPESALTAVRRRGITATWSTSTTAANCRRPARIPWIAGAVPPPLNELPDFGLLVSLPSVKILLVDDEEQVLAAWSEILQAAGPCEVHTAVNGGGALQAARAMGGPDVLVADIVMMPMDGLTLRDKLVAEFPHMRVVMVSGQDVSAHTERLAGAKVLKKPVDMEDLAKAVGFVKDAPPIGSLVAGFYLQEVLHRGRGIVDYVAWEANMSRHVVLHVLESSRATEPGAVDEFLASARTKAAVSHPSLLVVHDAGEADGWNYYSSDFLVGYPLAAYAAASQQLDDKALLGAMRSAAEVSGYFKEQGHARRSIHPEDVLFDSSLRSSLANVASAPESVDEAAEVRELWRDPGQAARPVGGGCPRWNAWYHAAAPVAAAPKDQATQCAERKSKRLLAEARSSSLLIGRAQLFLLVVADGPVFGGDSRSVATKMPHSRR